MTWCNLYSVESKYNINQQPIPVQVFSRGYWFICILSLFIVGVAASWWLCVIIMLLCTLLQPFAVSLLATSHVVNSLLVAKPIHGINLNSFLLSVDGEISDAFVNKLQIIAGSRVGFFGCWLKLLPQQQEQLLHNRRAFERQHEPQKQTICFLFKECFSERDYARLCRTVHRINRCKD